MRDLILDALTLAAMLGMFWALLLILPDHPHGPATNPVDTCSHSC
jgi:hypothetical protein